MAKIQSVEPNIADLAIGWMKSYMSQLFWHDSQEKTKIPMATKHPNITKKLFAGLCACVLLLSLTACKPEMIPVPEATIPQTPETTSFTPPVSGTSTANTEPSPYDGKDICRVTGAADATGIYSTRFVLGPDADTSGNICCDYFGVRGTAQADTIVAIFNFHYQKDPETGLYEVQTYLNGELLQNLHKQESVGVTNTFDAQTRAGFCRVTYNSGPGCIVFTLGEYTDRYFQ